MVYVSGLRVGQATMIIQRLGFGMMRGWGSWLFIGGGVAWGRGKSALMEFQDTVWEIFESMGLTITVVDSE
jgi:hypothetical protein